MVGIPCKECKAFRSLTEPCKWCARIAAKRIIVPDAAKIAAQLERKEDVAE